MAEEVKKIYFSYEEIHQLMENLAKRITADGHEFDCIITIASGGYIPARMLKTYINRPIYAINVSYYNELDQKQEEPFLIQWLSHPEKEIKNKRVLLVDEIDDTRSTLSYCATKLLEGQPKNLVVAVMHNKNAPKNAEIPAGIPYYEGAVIENHWACYPWEAEDILEHNRLTALYHESLKSR